MNASIDTRILPQPLPTPLTSLIGRDTESTALLEVLAVPDNRLVTVIGPGGVGKTRLAVHIATTLRDDGRDVLFVPVSAIRDAGLVIRAIGHGAGLSGEPPADAVQWVVEALQDRHCLLVIDNLEQVLGVAPDLARLLELCPLLTVLATSRSPLNIDGEHRFLLSPLATPDESANPGDILDTDAVTLFIERARAAHPGLGSGTGQTVTIGSICRQLDGLPLAIELAAARTAILPLPVLRERLEGQMHVLAGSRQDVPDRQKTMRDTISWSYELLVADEQRLFRFLGVFVGGFTVEAAESVGQEIGIESPHRVLQELVDQSLVRRIDAEGSEAHFQMLETVRTFALEQLELSGDLDAAQTAMATYIRDLSEKAEPHLRGPEQVEWMDRIQAEIDNIRAVMSWATRRRHGELVLAIINSIGVFCHERGYVREAQPWLETGIAIADDPLSSLRARAFNTLGLFAHSVRDNQASQHAYDKALQLSIALADKFAESRALIGLGHTAQARGDSAEARTFYEQAVTIARDIGSRRDVGVALGGIGLAHWYAGRFQEAISSLEEARKEVAASGDAVFESMINMNLGALFYGMDDIDKSAHYTRQALEMQRSTKSQSYLPVTLAHWAQIAMRRGDLEEANAAYTEAIMLFQRRGSRVYEAFALAGWATEALLRGDLETATRRILESNRLLSGSGDKIRIVENAESLAEIGSIGGQYVCAVEMLSAAASFRGENDLHGDPARQREIEKITEQVRKGLGEERFEALWQAVEPMNIDGLTRRISVIAREMIGTQQPSPDLPEAGAPATTDGTPTLTPRETDIVRLLVEGKSTPEIANELRIKPRTAATHITNMLTRLEVPSRTALVAWAIRSGIN